MKKLCILLLLLVSILTFGCSSDGEKPADEKSSTLNLLYGKWYVDCVIDTTTSRNGVGQFYQSIEEEYFPNSKFIYKYTLYHNSDQCNTNAVARVTYKGAYNIHSKYDGVFVGASSENKRTWKIDFDIETTDIEGNKLLAIATLNDAGGGKFYNIFSVDEQSKFDNYNVEDELNRATDLINMSTREDSFADVALQTPPLYDTSNAYADFIGNWDDGCVNDEETDNNVVEYYQKSILRFTGNEDAKVLELEESLWDNADCKGVSIASVTVTASVIITGTRATPISNVQASIAKFSFGQVAIYTGDADLANTSLGCVCYRGRTLYMMLFAEKNYDVLIYGGWFEYTLEDVPNELSFRPSIKDI